jgi:two-component system chemotaxis response regulator CheB
MIEIKRRVVRVLVADDSAVMRGILRTLFAAHAESPHGELSPMEVCGEAVDGVECLESVSRLQPDVLLLDLEMPRMHGLDVLDRLRAASPGLPVVMCSAYTERGARTTVDALSRGAADYVMKPSAESGFAVALETLKEQLLPKIAALAERRERRREAGQTSGIGWGFGGAGLENIRDAAPTRVEVLVVGVSTGGPAALEVMLPQLAVDLPVPILIVQHMPKLFTGALAERLDQCCALQVREAYEGAVPMPGTVWLAPGDVHMEIGTTRLTDDGDGVVRVSLHPESPVNYCRPSVDRLFDSAADVHGAGTLALVMTGMGADGLAGARRVHAAGGAVLAQDEGTSVVWGMPGRVAQAGIASGILPLSMLADELTRRIWLGRRGPRRRSLVEPDRIRSQYAEVADGLL